MLRASASAGRDPELLDHLGAVEQRHLRRRHGGDEEARVVALGPAERRQPVAEIDQRAGIEADAFLAAHLGDAVLAPVQHAAPGREPVGGLAVEHVVVVADGASEQQARFLEGLADRGDEEVEAAVRRARAGRWPRRRRCRSRRMGVAVARHRRCRRETPRRRWCSRCRRRDARAAPRCRRRRRGRRRWSPPAAAAAPAPAGRRGPGRPTRRRRKRSSQ